MGAFRLAVVTIGVAWLLAPSAARAQGKNEKAPDRVGRITLEGNTDTPDRIILGLIEFRPGQVLLPAQLDSIRKRLVASGLFSPVSPPTVAVVPNDLDGTFKDINVKVTERPGAWVCYAAISWVTGVVTLDLALLRETAVDVLRRFHGKP